MKEDDVVRKHKERWRRKEFDKLSNEEKWSFYRYERKWGYMFFLFFLVVALLCVIVSVYTAEYRDNTKHYEEIIHDMAEEFCQQKHGEHEYNIGFSEDEWNNKIIRIECQTKTIEIQGASRWEY